VCIIKIYLIHIIQVYKLYLKLEKYLILYLYHTQSFLDIPVYVQSGYIFLIVIIQLYTVFQIFNPMHCTLILYIILFRYKYVHNQSIFGSYYTVIQFISSLSWINV